MDSTPQAPATNLTAANRINVPAVCRLPGRGTACVISPGILLTSTRVIASKADAAKAKAVFFEGGKREKVTVDLRPDIFFFAAAFPSHVDYCLVACDTDGIRNVTPVKIPLLQTEIPIVREGDTLLVVQHPLYSTLVTQESKGAGMSLEVKRFEEVLRRRDDLLHLRTNSAYTCFGCPSFNDEGLLVGLQSQLGAEAPPSINPASESQLTVGASIILSIATIVKHMFANGHLGQVDRPLASDSLWQSWGIEKDAARTILVIQNFSRNKELHRKAALHLFELVNSADHVQSVAACNGGPVVLASMKAHFDEPNIVSEALKAMWNLGFVVADGASAAAAVAAPDQSSSVTPGNQLHQPTPIEPVVAALTKYGADTEEIAQVAVVLLFNATTSTTAPLDPILIHKAPDLVFGAMKRFSAVEVLQKFGLGFLKNVLRRHDDDCGGDGDELAIALVDGGIMEHASHVMERFPRSEFLHEHATGFFERIAMCGALRGHQSLAVCVPQLIASILRFPRSHAIAVAGCNALWGLGNDPAIRMAIFTHDHGVEALKSAMSVGHSK